MQSLNRSVPSGGTWGKTNNFSFVPSNTNPRQGCHHLGDITVRVQPTTAADPSLWALYSSVAALDNQAAPAVNSSSSAVLTAHDLTSLMNETFVDRRYGNTSNPFYASIPLKVVRSYESYSGSNGAGDGAGDGSSESGGMVIRFEITNTFTESVRIGALGASMPGDGMTPLYHYHYLCSVVLYCVCSVRCKRMPCMNVSRSLVCR